ncbi:MAG TPA: hypothetical protein VJN02_03240 [Gammaproteobacteria bacterium]|nr:hypothetical protein [Gammaproteobacteria bacterium]
MKSRLEELAVACGVPEYRQSDPGWILRNIFIRQNQGTPEQLAKLISLAKQQVRESNK